MDADTEPKRQLRRDAQGNREALIQAAASAFEQDGFSVPLEKVIARAGVGRGTLYRHFEDRTDLLVVVIERELDNLEKALEPAMTLPEAFEALCLAGVRISAIVRRVSADLASLGERPGLTGLSDRFERMLAPHLERSKEIGEIDPAVSVTKAALACQMIGNVLFPTQSPEELAATVRSGIEIVIGGLRPTVLSGRSTET